MPIAVFDISNAQKVFKEIERSKRNTKGAQASLESAFFNSLRKRGALPDKKKNIVNVNVPAGNNPLTQSITGSLLATNNLVTDKTDTLVSSGINQTFQELSLKEADVLTPDILASKVRKSIRDNKTNIVNNLLKRKEVINSIKSISFPITLPDGSTFGIIANDIIFVARDFNIKVNNVQVAGTNVKIGLDVSLNSKGFDKIIRKLQQSLSNSAEDVVLNFRSKYRTEEAFIGAMLALRSSAINVGVSDKGTLVNVNTFTEEEEQPSILDATSALYNRLINTLPESELTRRLKISVARRMPKGPPGGRVTKPNILTYRTGTFVRSIEAFYDRKFQAVKYFYAPNYYVHEQTGRDPRDLIEGSLSTIIQKAVGGQVRISKL